MQARQKVRYYVAISVYRDDYCPVVASRNRRALSPGP